MSVSSERWPTCSGTGRMCSYRIYAQTLPESMRAVTDKISRRAGDS